MNPWHLQENTEQGSRLAGPHRLRVGHYVRVEVVEMSDTSSDEIREDVWLRITEQLGPAEFVGYPILEPERVRSLTSSTDVVFGPRDVHQVGGASKLELLAARPLTGMAVIESAGDGSADGGQAGDGQAVSARPDSWARLAFRVEPVDDGDSGWRLATGPHIEPRALRPGAAETELVPLAQLAHRDPSLEPLLRAPVGAWFERDYPGDTWVKCGPRKLRSLADAAGDAALRG